MIQVEVAILMELLALFGTLSVLAVGRVKLVMQMNVLFGFSAADKVCVFLQRMILVVTHVSDRQDQTQPLAFIASATFRKPAMFAPAM